jgi:hypothetical protein
VVFFKKLLKDVFIAMDLTHFRRALDAFPPHVKETCDHVLALKKANPHTEDLWNVLYLEIVVDKSF